MEVADIIADLEPAGDVSAELHTKVVALVHVRILLEHSLLSGVASGNEIVDVAGSSREADRMTGGRLDVIVKLMPPVCVSVVVVGVLTTSLVDDNPWTGRILFFVVSADP